MNVWFNAMTQIVLFAQMQLLALVLHAFLAIN